MIDAFYDFEWRVAPGYGWQDWLNNRGAPVVVPARGFYSLESALAVGLTWNQSQEKNKKKFGPILTPLVEEGTSVRTYRPMDREHAGLFRAFGEVDYRSCDEVLAFAGRHGLLGLDTQEQLVRLRVNGKPRWHHAAGESFLDWSFEICLMREGIDLAGGLRSGKDSQRLRWLFDRNLQKVQGRVAFDKSGEPRLVLAPLSLVAAMWLQLALGVTGGKRFVECKFCRRVMEISTEQTGFRSHREFCSDSCKTKDYRKRKRAALAFGAAGVPLVDISERTATDRATVRSWLAATKTDGRKAHKRGA